MTSYQELLIEGPARSYLAEANATSAVKDRSDEDHEDKNYCAALTAENILISGDVAVFNQAMRRRFYVDAATGSLYTPGRK